MTLKFRDKTRGRWRGILSDLGIPATTLTGKHGPCPLCGDGKDRFRFDDKGGDGTWICSQCGAGDGISLLMKKRGIDFKTAAQLVDPIYERSQFLPPTKLMTSDDARYALSKMWRAATNITVGDPVDLYLRSRGLGQKTYPTALQYAPSLKYRDGDEPNSWHPGMLAAIIDVDGKPGTLHRTFLTMDGRKADVTSVRKLMTGGFPHGAAVRLGPVASTIGIAEGIETALAASALFSLPVWAAINSTGLEKFMPPDGVSEVVIFGDNDPKYGGQAAAWTLAHRLAVTGIGARVKIPLTMGQDWNDVHLSANQRRAA